MSTVEFDEEPGSAAQFYRSPKILGEPQTPGMVKVLMKSGLIKSQKAAFFSLLGIIFGSVAASAVLLYYSYGGTTLRAIPYDQMTPSQKKNIPFEERMYLESKKQNPA